MLLKRSECVEILENMLKMTTGDSEHAKLLDYHLVRDDTAIGYLGDYYALTLRYYSAGEKNEQQIQLFIKALPQQSAEIEKEAIFRKESWIYNNLLNVMQLYSNLKWSARCYYTRADLLVLENIKLTGYRSSSNTELQASSMFELMRSLAAFHAASFNYEHQTKQNIGEAFADHLQEITVSADIAWFTTGLSAVLAIIRSLPQYQSAKYQKFIDHQLSSILDRIYDQAATSLKYCNVLCHRDLWAGNIFLPFQNQGVALLVDFQTCRYSPPAVDLIFSLYMNLSVYERKRLETPCLDLYYNCLVENLLGFGLQSSNRLLTKLELITSFEEFRLFGVVYKAVAATIVKVPSNFVTNEYKYVDRSKIILSYMQENEKFRACMEECCSEVMELALSMAN